MNFQVPSIILPTTLNNPPTGLETETVNNLVCHNSIDIPLLRDLEYKTVEIIATEGVIVGVPGTLWAWIELSPVSSLVSTSYWGAIGGGGGAIYQATGALPPLAPYTEAALGVNGVPHNIKIPWTVHSDFARLVVQTPVSATPLTAFWVVQAIFSGRQ